MFCKLCGVGFGFAGDAHLPSCSMLQQTRSGQASQSQSQTPSAELPSPGTALLCTDHTGSYRCWITRTELDRVLAQFGLAIIPIAGVPSPEDRRVLETSSKVAQRWLESYVRIITPTQADPQAFAWAEAELARRAAKEKQGG